MSNLKPGDVIWVDEAWEDQAGHYHGEKARILEIDNTGEMKLDFFEASPEVREWLAGTDGYMADEYDCYHLPEIGPSDLKDV